VQNLPVAKRLLLRPAFLLYIGHAGLIYREGAKDAKKCKFATDINQMHTDMSPELSAFI